MKITKRQVKQLLNSLRIGTTINAKDWNMEIHHLRQPKPTGLFASEIRIEFDTEDGHCLYQIFAVGVHTKHGKITWCPEYTIIDITID